MLPGGNGEDPSLVGLGGDIQRIVLKPSGRLWTWSFGWKRRYGCFYKGFDWEAFGLGHIINSGPTSSGVGSSVGVGASNGVDAIVEAVVFPGLLFAVLLFVGLLFSGLFFT